MNGQTHWVQVIGDGVTQATVTYNDLSGTLMQFHLKDGRRVEVKIRGTLAALCSVANHYQALRAHVQVKKDADAFASCGVEVCRDSFCGTTLLQASIVSAQSDPQAIMLRIWPLTLRQDLLGEADARQKADAVAIENLKWRIAELEDDDEEDEEEEEEEEAYDSPSPDALIEVIAWLTRMAQRK